MQAFGTMPVRGQRNETGAMRDASCAFGGHESAGSREETKRRADTTPGKHEAS
jgi:hypothetical protein